MVISSRPFGDGILYEPDDARAARYDLHALVEAHGMRRAARADGLIQARAARALDHLAAAAVLQDGRNHVLRALEQERLAAAARHDGSMKFLCAREDKTTKPDNITVDQTDGCCTDTTDRDERRRRRKERPIEAGHDGGERGERTHRELIRLVEAGNAHADAIRVEQDTDEFLGLAVDGPGVQSLLGGRPFGEFENRRVTACCRPISRRPQRPLHLRVAVFERHSPSAEERFRRQRHARSRIGCCEHGVVAAGLLSPRCSDL